MTDVAARPDAPTPARDEVFLVDPSIRARRRENVLVAVVRVAIAAVGLLAWEFASGRWISEFWISSPTAVWWALLRFVEERPVAAGRSGHCGRDRGGLRRRRRGWDHRGAAARDQPARRADPRPLLLALNSSRESR